MNTTKQQITLEQTQITRVESTDETFDYIDVPTQASEKQQVRYWKTRKLKDKIAVLEDRRSYKKDLSTGRRRSKKKQLYWKTKKVKETKEIKRTV